MTICCCRLCEDGATVINATLCYIPNSPAVSLMLKLFFIISLNSAGVRSEDSKLAVDSGMF